MQDVVWIDLVHGSMPYPLGHGDVFFFNILYIIFFSYVVLVFSLCIWVCDDLRNRGQKKKQEGKTRFKTTSIFARGGGGEIRGRLKTNRGRFKTGSEVEVV